MESDTKFSIMICATIFMAVFILGYLLSTCVPTAYQDVCVKYKFIRGNDCYIIGTSIEDGKEQIDLYKISAQDYDKLTEGSEYTISTTNYNYWNQIKKTIYEFKNKGEESND